jgi:hypothetical protein
LDAINLTAINVIRRQLVIEILTYCVTQILLQ